MNTELDRLVALYQAAVRDVSDANYAYREVTDDERRKRHACAVADRELLEAQHALLTFLNGEDVQSEVRP